MSSRETQKLPELEKHLIEQIDFLMTSSKLYDEGHHAEAKRLALALRILFHDTRKSKSLLNQLNLKEISWINTAAIYDPQNLVSHVGLITVKFENSLGRIPWLIPKGSPTDTMIRLPFKEWWEMPVIVSVADTTKHVFTRENLILNVADTDGGAHIDSELETDYMKLSRKNSIGYTAIRNNIEYPLIAPELPSLRQISHEVLLTLESELPGFFKEAYNHRVGDAPYGISIESGPPAASTLRIYIIN